RRGVGPARVAPVRLPRVTRLECAVRPERRALVRAARRRPGHPPGEAIVREERRVSVESSGDEERSEERVAGLVWELPDPKAREELVLVYQPLAEYLARKFSGRGEQVEDLVQVDRRSGGWGKG